MDILIYVSQQPCEVDIIIPVIFQKMKKHKFKSNVANKLYWNIGTITNISLTTQVMDILTIGSVLLMHTSFKWAIM